MATNGNPSDLTTRQRRAVACLLAERNVKDAAAAAGVGERTLHTWLTMPAFVLALRNAETAAIDQAARRLVALAGGAVDVLSETMADKEGAPALRLRAAQVALDDLLRLRELATLEARLTALEAAQEAKDGA